MTGTPSEIRARRWYVVHIKARQELLVAGLLEAMAEVVVYLPQVTRRTGQRAKAALLFPGYLFVQADLGQTRASAIDKTPGVIRLVAFGGQPQPVPDAAMASLQARVQELNQQGGLPQHPFQPGDSVRITEGPLGGLEGVFQGPMRPAQRVRVLLQFLGGLHELEVDPGLLERSGQLPAGHPPRRTRGKGRVIRR
jgi:transcriptional antiterminator RfaH